MESSRMKIAARPVNWIGVSLGDFALRLIVA